MTTARRFGKAHSGDVVEVRGDLGVVGGDVGQCVGGQTLAELRRQRAHLAQLGDELFVVSRRGHGRNGCVIARRGTEQCSTADVDHLDGLVERHGALADLGAEGLDVDHDQVNQLYATCCQLFELAVDLAPSEDAGIDVGVEGLDLAAGKRLGSGQFA